VAAPRRAEQPRRDRGRASGGERAAPHRQRESDAHGDRGRLNDLVAVCTDAAAAWHASWLTALGLRSERRGPVWLALDAPPFIYWTAIPLAPDVSESDVADATGTVCDAWCRLELAPFGFDLRDRDGREDTAREPWFVRPPGPLAAEPAPPELEVVRAATPAEVAEFEAVSVHGFAGEDAPVEPGALHPPAVLADERMTMLTGRVDGRPVAAATSYRTDASVGIYGVTTVASARGRGYASALTRELVDAALPASLSPSPEAERLYRRLGFEEVGALRQWSRAQPAATSGSIEGTSPQSSSSR
jgi:GNAT superfamily N-acetyltransferase